MTTKIIADRADRLSTLRSINPSLIAVAYVGRGWRKLLGDQIRLREIVLSPTQGTNPTAVEQIARVIGWENVHFLDELHAKIYLGDHKVMFGSANLSDNAFGQSSMELYEVVAYSDNREMFRQATSEFDRYRSLAIDSYKDTSAKKKRIKELKKARTAVEMAQSLLERPKAPSLSTFEIGSRRIHLEWHEADGSDTDDFDGQDGDRDFMNVAVAKSDQMKVGDWILEWPCTQEGRIVRGFRLSWMRIDAVRLQVNRMEYPDQVAQRNIAPRNSQPFEIDEIANRAFKELIQDWPELRPKGDGIALQSPPMSKVNKFLLALKKRYVELAR